MAQYAIAFDMDTKAMEANKMTKSERTKLYQTEIPQALKACGFTVHPQGSLYHTNSDENPITALMTLQSVLKAQAPQFCNYVRRVHVFRMEEWSDVTSLLSTKDCSQSEPTAQEEIENQELINETEVAA